MLEIVKNLVYYSRKLGMNSFSLPQRIWCVGHRVSLVFESPQLTSGLYQELSSAKLDQFIVEWSSSYTDSVWSDWDVHLPRLLKEHDKEIRPYFVPVLSPLDLEHILQLLRLCLKQVKTGTCSETHDPLFIVLTHDVPLLSPLHRPGRPSGESGQPLLLFLLSGDP